MPDLLRLKGPLRQLEDKTIRNFVRIPITALLAVALLFPIIAAPVAATGTCGNGHIIFYQWKDFTGKSIKYCYGVSDAEMDFYGAYTNNLGPDVNGAYKNDFNSNAAWSGIRSIHFYDPTSDSRQANVCLYYVQNFASGGIGDVMSLVHSTGYYVLPDPNVLVKTDLSSFRWTTVTSVHDC